MKLQIGRAVFSCSGFILFGIIAPPFSKQGRIRYTEGRIGEDQGDVLKTFEVTLLLKYRFRGFHIYPGVLIAIEYS